MAFLQKDVFLTEILIVSMLITLTYGVVLFVKYKKYVFAQIYFFALSCITLSYLYEAILYLLIPDFDWLKMTISDISDIGYYLLIILMYKLMEKTITTKTGIVNIYNDKKKNIFSFVIALMIAMSMFVGVIITTERTTVIIYCMLMLLVMYSMFLNVRMLLYQDKEKKYFNSMRMFNVIILLLMILQTAYYSFLIEGFLLAVFDLLFYPLSFLSMMFLKRGLNRWV